MEDISNLSLAPKYGFLGPSGFGAPAHQIQKKKRKNEKKKKEEWNEKELKKKE